MSRSKKLALLLAFGGAGWLGLQLGQVRPPLTPAQVAARRGVAPAPVVPGHPPAPGPQTTARRLPAPSRVERESPREGRDDDEQAFVEANLRALERLRRIPGAAPLLDDILAFLKNDRQDEVSLDRIPTDKNGLAVLDDDAVRHMIGNDAIREKWEKLMALVAAHPELAHER